jgi:hypothetical protein
MATIQDTNTPQFVLFPVNNDRTAWKDFGLPAILVVPHRRDNLGLTIPNSNIFNVRIFIENVPDEAKVAGHQNIGKRYPDKELYRRNILTRELSNRFIDLRNYDIAKDGNIIAFDKAKTGDIVTFTTSTGITDTLTFIKHADYYDLSDIKLEDLEILPNDLYNLVYETSYFTRKMAINETNELLCIDTTFPAIAQTQFRLNHPGEIISEMHNLTPAVYLTDAYKRNDKTLEFYRPFSDILNDVYDEQRILKSINWVKKAPSEAIPYISQLLGWGTQHFPQSTVNLSRAVLRRTVELQKIRGSRQALSEIFRTFGLELLISNLWWSSDGKKLIAPGDILPDEYVNQKITVKRNCQTDLLLDEYAKNGYGEFQIPLLFRPLQKDGFDDFVSLREGGNITVDAYIVKKDSSAHVKLAEVANKIKTNPEGYSEANGGCIKDSSGFINATDLHTSLSGLNVEGYSQILLTGKVGKSTDSIKAGPNIPLTEESCSFNRDNNILSVTLSGYKSLKDDKLVTYAFATYQHDVLIVPDILKDLQSNYFNIQVVASELESRLLYIANKHSGQWKFHGSTSAENAGLLSPIVLDFAMEYLFKAKAFHSLLNVVKYTIEITETYQTNDICLGGDITQRFDVDMGRLQVPPAIIPNVVSEGDCANSDPISLGYKDDDILYRLRVLENLPEEFQSWKNLDDSEIIQITPTRIILPKSISGRNECKYTHTGQDRLLKSDITTESSVEHGPNPNANQGAFGVVSNQDLSPVDIVNNGVYDKGAPATTNSDSNAFGSFMKETDVIRDVHCELEGIKDYCYKGRVDNELLYRPTLLQSESRNNGHCKISMGNGVYWSYKTITRRVIHGNDVVAADALRGNTETLSSYSGANSGSNLIGHLTADNNDLINIDYTTPLTNKHNHYLGRLYRAYDVPIGSTLHFTDRKESPPAAQSEQLALQKPELNIIKPTLHLPGCRFPTMHALAANYTTSAIKAKPWDDAFSSYCGPANLCSDDPSLLNAKLIKDTAGDYVLQFDDQDYKINGNGLTPDVPSLGDHTLGTGSIFEHTDIIHKVYLDDNNGHTAITLDSTCDFDSNVNDGIIEKTSMLFDSADLCNSGVYQDFAGGHPCVSGYQDYNDADLGRNGLYTELFTALGVEASANTADSILFLLGSGILVEYGHRLDCGCQVVDCNPSDGNETICSANIFLDNDSYYDWDHDHIIVDNVAVLEEKIGTCSNQLSGNIENLLELV